MERVDVFRDCFQNFKTYGIPHAQLILADPPYCYDEQTECWTRNGWKKYSEITMDDEVMSLNHETMVMEYSKIQNIIIKDNDEPMYHFKHQYMDLMVTKEHRLFAVNYYSTKDKYKNLVSRSKVHIKKPYEVNSSYGIPSHGYRWETMNTDDHIVIPPVEILTNGKEGMTEPILIPYSVWLPFFGLWLADGCWIGSKSDGNGKPNYTVSIKQFGENRERVRQILSKMPFKYCEYEEKDRPSSNFNIHSKQLWMYLKQFGDSSYKFIPRYILDLNKPYLNLFWDAYTFGDSTKNGKGIKISSVSKNLIEGLQEIALKLGHLCNIQSVAANPEYDKLMYFFQYNAQRNNYKYSTPEIITDYSGKVWCLTLETNSVFLVRRNNRIAFSGNCLGNNAYASNPTWYVDGDNKNGESDKAGKQFFNTDLNFRPAEFMHFCSQMLVKEPKEGLTDEEIESGEYGQIKDERLGDTKKKKSQAPCMIIFCAFEQLFDYIDLGKRYGFQHYIPLVFRKKFSAQVLKANMKIVGNCEYGLCLYKDRLPKFNNNGAMVFNCFDWPTDTKTPKIHPTQKPVQLLERLIEIFTDKNDVVIDPCCGSGSTLLAAANLGRRAYGFEIDRKFYEGAKKLITKNVQPQLF